MKKVSIVDQNCDFLMGGRSCLWLCLSKYLQSAQIPCFQMSNSWLYFCVATEEAKLQFRNFIHASCKD